MGIFMFGSLLAGFSRTIIELIVLRGVAGAGGGGIISIGQIVISDVVTLRDRCGYQIGLLVMIRIETPVCGVFIQRQISGNHWCGGCIWIRSWTAYWRFTGRKGHLAGTYTLHTQNVRGLYLIGLPLVVFLDHTSSLTHGSVRGSLSSPSQTCRGRLPEVRHIRVFFSFCTPSRSYAGSCSRLIILEPS